MKINISIVYFGDIYDVNGVNFVTNLLILGKNIFSANDIQMNKIFCLNGVISINEVSKLNIGKDVNKKSYLVRRYLRENLSLLFNSKIKEFAWFKVQNSYLKPSKLIIEKNIVEIKKNNVIIFQDIFTAYYFLKLEKRKKTILILHCEDNPFEQLLKYYPSLSNTKYHAFLIEIKEFVYKNISKVVFLSKRAFNNNILMNSTFIYNGIPDLQNHKYSDSKNIVNLVCVGSMTGHKGQELIINSMKLLSSEDLSIVKLIFIGSGPKEKDLKDLTNKLELSKYIYFYGIRNDVDVLLEEMDVLLLPSKSEGMPLCIIEAMRQGMFIVASDVGGISEMIDSSFGKLITRSPKEIAIVIKEILKGEVNCNYKINSRETYLKKFKLETMIMKYSNVVKELYNEDN